MISLPDCTNCAKFSLHIDLADEARTAYRAEGKSLPSKITVSVDMQKVVMLPGLPGIKEAIFCKRLVVFNETFATIGKKPSQKPIGVLWNEAIKGRSAEDVASSFITLIRNFRDCEKFVFLADNCSGQNKNWFLYTALVNKVNRLTTATKEITIKYFEPGHTFMSADSFHHKVEQAMQIEHVVEFYIKRACRDCLRTSQYIDVLKLDSCLFLFGFNTSTQ